VRLYTIHLNPVGTALHDLHSFF